MKLFETERLLLRPWQESDLQDFYEYGRNPEVGPNAGWKPHENIGESREILEKFVKSNNEFAIVLKENGKAIGSMGFEIDRTHNENLGKGRELGYVLSHDYWGRGLMPEAVRGALKYVFEEREYDYFAVAHFPFNQRSKRVIEKCGFRYQKTLKDSAVNYDGTKLDELCYVMTKEDYFSHR